MIANVKSTWVDGNLVFSTADGTEIATFDAENEVLDVKALALDGVGITVSAGEINKLDGSGAVIASGTKSTLIADLTDTATGAEIASAVNAIIDALIAFKITAAE